VADVNSGSMGKSPTRRKRNLQQFVALAVICGKVKRTVQHCQERIMSTKHRVKDKASQVKFSKRLEMVNRSAAGVDVGSTEMWVCAPAGESAVEVKLFGAFTRDLRDISEWLRAHGVVTVAMESTGVYWIPLFQRLEWDGFEVFLVNARFVKSVGGRPKTDIHDCQWIQRLHSYGLLPRSFRPDDSVCRLRAIVRHRGTLVEESSTQVQRIQKVLHEMNLQLDKAISDITGVTGLRILEAILSGTRDPMALAELRDQRIAASKETIAAALEGDYRDECLFIMRQCLDSYYSFRGQIDQCDQWLGKCLTEMAGKANVEMANNTKAEQGEAGRPKRKKQTRNAPSLDVGGLVMAIAGVDLTRIDGLGPGTVMEIVAETGFDMGKWPTSEHFASWLGLCPNLKISNSKVLSSQSKRNQSRAAKAFRLGAQALCRSQSYLGAFYRRMRARIGGAKANTATARKLAVIFYTMLATGRQYEDLGEDHFERRHKERALKGLRLKAESMGYELVEKKTA
jgi:transposase